MELLSPAGNVEKLKYCYTYGADSAYIGLKNFSLRVKADNFYEDEHKRVIELKKQFPGRRLHCALNIAFHNDEIDRLIKNIPYFKEYPIDAFIVQDLGIVPILQKEFPNADLHLSTQASCMNREAVKVYKSLGFKRVVMGREASLQEIAEIKDAVPDMEIECFVHGAMCIAYAGRCLMSAYLNGRSAQEGFCSHTCRWDYDVLAKIDSSKDAKKIAESGNLLLCEHKRPDEYFPVYEGENFTAVLSSKDLCMIDHLAELKKAGVDSLKIEGRMKSVYYVAMITRAYRKALDALDGKLTDAEAKPFIDELYKVSHRPFATGFYFNKADADVAVSGASDSPFELSAEIGLPLDLKQTEEILKLAADGKKLRQSKIDAMCPPELKAYQKRVADKPDMHLPFAEKKEGWKMYPVEPLNMLTKETEIEMVSPDVVGKKIEWGKDFIFINPENGQVYNWVCNGHPCVLYTGLNITDGTLLRSKDSEYVEGKFRDNGR
ncbi:MAG: peptidase U32 family protein [Treponema sp.]|nr:U32 family peptidase [Spirochaetia bacterium]MDD7458886.1 U32 family peptidase [Spirochaetales bacterium]MDY5810465.1 peptidase U32 family protein [Treponema sp.]